MTDIFQLPSPSSSTNSATPPKNNDALSQQTCFLNHGSFINSNSLDLYSRNNNCNTSRQIQGVGAEEEEVSVLEVLATVLRKYSVVVGCNSKSGDNCGAKEQLMEIGVPTNVRHVAHVTFDRFNGFLGLPVEFEPEVPRRPPSASTRVFGVSTESMQLSIDARGNCVPTILLMMQRSLYEQGGLQSEGIFRINPENGQEEHVREQLNNGVIPENIDVHCLAGLIKAWFRELPNGILDSLPPEQVMEAQSEDECARLVKLLPPTEGALLDWAINLMADVAQFEHFNKMNARNIAMVFAPNMTQMSDPLTALMFAVQVMNFLKTLIEKVLREREDCLIEAGPMLPFEPSNEDGHHSTLQPITLEANDKSTEEDEINVDKEPLSNQISSYKSHSESSTDENINVDNTPADDPNSLGTAKDEVDQSGNNSVGIGKTQPRRRRAKNGLPNNNRNDAKRKGSRKHIAPRSGEGDEHADMKKKESNIVRRVNSHAERVETWR
ncbi:rho GTPase-activating protein 1 [Phtheirospermum japonicum]|uniref:Rho GTPase-activating protein 1 n=1 Tax=Phtheirospermum japonicum TaxID=374723 RepID=A0A830D0B9_9LAMI|nr:rho GTPase-activating protein 1 [Phtheirospermum japonicum]